MITYQIDKEGNLVKDKDEVLLGQKKDKVIMEALEGLCDYVEYGNHNLLRYNKTIFLTASITYLGTPHPHYKKRMQLKGWYRDAVDFFEKKGYKVLFLGVYKYKENIIFVDFLKETYLENNINNSSAHVYTNHLFQSVEKGVYRHVDQNGNIINVIKASFLKKYLDKNVPKLDHEIDLIKSFNKSNIFKGWIWSIFAISDMYYNEFNHWRQIEWPGFYIEYKFQKYLKENTESKYIKYLDREKDQLDFDIYFPINKFYGDLKTSDRDQNQAPGNDKKNFDLALKHNDRFWYIIYEHKTLKPQKPYFFIKARNFFIKSNHELNNSFNPLSGKRLKSAVEFTNMFILEINKVNRDDALSDFNQGKQPTGEKRKTKYMINKDNIDNFIIYEETFK